MRRTLAEGRLVGIVSGLGGATGDAIYGCMAGFGLTFISNILIGQQALLRLIGGLFLCYLGTKTLLAKPAKRAALTKGNGLAGAYASTFFLTLTNPMTILSFVALFAGLGLASTGGDFLCYLGTKTLLAKPAKRAALTKGNGLAGAYASTFFLTLTNPMTILSFVALFAGLGLASTGGDFLSTGALVLGVFIGSSSWLLILCSSVHLFREKFDSPRLQWVNRISGAIIAGFGLIALLSLE